MQMQLLEEIKALRIKKRISQVELAKLAGVKQSAISRIENNTNQNPKLATVTKIVHAMNYELKLVKKKKKEQ